MEDFEWVLPHVIAGYPVGLVGILLASLLVAFLEAGLSEPVEKYPNLLANNSLLRDAFKVAIGLADILRACAFQVNRKTLCTFL